MTLFAIVILGVIGFTVVLFLLAYPSSHPAPPHRAPPTQTQPPIVLVPYWTHQTTTFSGTSWPWLPALGAEEDEAPEPTIRIIGSPPPPSSSSPTQAHITFPNPWEEILQGEEEDEDEDDMARQMTDIWRQNDRVLSLTATLRQLGRTPGGALWPRYKRCYHKALELWEMQHVDRKKTH